ncbi:polysaccharide deacetylase family protein [Segetibacter koreensis]|uniref:polysaccharide deacetylase family protein n=1 Tax=Segetibacter koreensis TaxID=398037 RepID=UPI00037D9BB0|nr:polysaccharide deacetylase family protein [Segetibacter koreensis]
MKLNTQAFQFGCKHKQGVVTVFPHLIMLFFIILLGGVAKAQQNSAAFSWPDGKQVAISLTFDDGRTSQVDAGTALLDQYGVKATFYVVPSAVKQRLEGWKKAVASGHEIGNHSLHHPCTGNFPWSRQKALEDYTLDKMQRELIVTNDSIQYLLGVTPKNFAFPCGQTFVGRGVNTKSYVPIVARLFVSGRGWLDEGPNDPTFCDFAQLTGMEMDGKDFDQVLPLIQSAKETGKWLVLAGHEMGDSGQQTTRLAMLKQLIEYAQNPANGVWIAPVENVAEYIKKQRK